MYFEISVLSLSNKDDFHMLDRYIIPYTLPFVFEDLLPIFLHLIFYKLDLYNVDRIDQESLLTFCSFIVSRKEGKGFEKMKGDTGNLTFSLKLFLQDYR